MKFTENPFAMLLGIIFIGVGIVSLLSPSMVAIPDIPLQIGALVIPQFLHWVVLGLAVIIALVVFLAKSKQPVGFLMGALFLAYVWALNYFHLNFNYRDLILGAIPIAGGVFMLMGM